MKLVEVSLGGVARFAGSCFFRRNAIGITTGLRCVHAPSSPHLVNLAANQKGMLFRNFSSVYDDSKDDMKLTVMDLLRDIGFTLEQKDRIAPNLSVVSQPVKVHAPSVRLRSMVGRFGRSYRALDSIQLNSPGSCQRTQVLRYIASECSMDPSKVISAVQLLEKAANHWSSYDAVPLTAYDRIQESCTPIYDHLFRLLLQENAIEGMQSLLEIREDLLRWIPCLASTDDRQAKLLNQLKRMDSFLQQLLSSWIVPGLIEFRRLTYEETSASIVERMVRNEKVHAVTSLDDLRKRLGPGRRVFALFHPCIPGEPLFVLYVALKEEVPSSMEQIHSIDRDNFAAHPTVATFYSISSLRSGLSGMGLAEHLIHSAVEYLQGTVPSILTFCTLSPVPGFCTWLGEKMKRSSDSEQSLPVPSDTVIATVREIIGESESSDSTFEILDASLNRLTTIKDNRTMDNEPLLEALRPWLMACAAQFLAREKHRRKPLDRVARFHIANGAILDRIHWKADLSRTGWTKSLGIMVTYRYDLTVLSENRLLYHQMSETNSTDPIPLGSEMEDLLLKT